MSNLDAFLTTIAISELSQSLIDVSDNGYNIIVGSTPAHPDLFTSYSDHPRKLVDLGNGLESTAAGRYQILEHFYDAYKTILNLPDFSPTSQDKIAIQLIKECGAIQDIEDGIIQDAIFKCRSRWASLPASPYGQHTNKLSDLLDAYENAGGVIAT